MELPTPDERVVIERLRCMRESYLRACAEQAVLHTVELAQGASETAQGQVRGIVATVLKSVSIARGELEKPAADDDWSDTATHARHLLDGEPLPLCEQLNLADPAQAEFDSLARQVLQHLEGTILLPAKHPKTERYGLAIGADNPQDLFLVITRSEMDIPGIQHHFGAEDDHPHPNGVYYSLAINRIPKLPR